MREIFGSEPATQASAFYLRYQVFVLEQGISPELEFDALDTPDRRYIVLFDGNIPVATARFQTIHNTILNPDRLCVARSFRQQGLGKKLLSKLEKLGLAEGYETSLLSAEVSAQIFYEKSGYHVVSDIFKEDGIPCVKMQKALTADE
ncbi:GNAT family N-acetyltransferase [Enterococcus viikkiensis]|uniref:GNAT family N-acetyltransferase n=1 Tax=Enterococcus viikkiensis TaxID=930854 RepID=UPI003F8E7D23